MKSTGIILFVSAVASLSAGCGGQAFTVVDPGPQQDSGPHPGTDAAADAPLPWSPVCPATLPSTGSACTGANLECEYGTDPNPACNQIVSCQGGTWHASGFFGQCRPPAPQPPSCPASLHDIKEGAACSPEEVCEYPDGRCTCSPPFGGPLPQDAGGAHWSCLPGAGCPYPRPRVGSSCTQANESCTYYECSYSQVCSGGVWTAQPEACAGAGSGG